MELYVVWQTMRYFSINTSMALSISDVVELLRPRVENAIFEF